MSITLDTTPGGSTANSFASLAEANTYYDTRPLKGTDANGQPFDVWVPTGDVPLERLIWATRVLCAHFQPRKTLVIPDPKYDSTRYPYYRIERTWAGYITPGSLQALPFGRNGLYDALGRPIDPSIVPDGIKLAQIELAGLLALSDSTLQSDIVVQGITRLKVDVVDLSFKDGVPLTRVIPMSVLEYMPPNWLTDERFEGARSLVFEAI